MSEVVFSPVESDRQGYFIIPGYSKNLVSRNGVVICRESGESVSQHTSTEYNYTFIYSDKFGKKRSIGVHRLMALAFHGLPTKSKRIVNHKDGIKTNNVDSNIEWSTYGWNIDHAYRSDLRSDNRPVLLKDLRTGEVTRFHALTECARQLGVSPAAMCKYLKRPNRVVLCSFFTAKYDLENEPWPNLTAVDVERSFNGLPKDTCAYHIESGTVYVAESMGKLSELIGVSRSAIGWAIKSCRQKPIRGYLFKLIVDPTPWNIPDNTTSP